MKKILLLLLLSPLSLFSESFYEQAKDAYAEHNYTGAFKLFHHIYEENNDEDAAYQLAKMYELGKGTDKNLSLSNHWYHLAADRYFKNNETKYDNVFNKHRRLLFSKLGKIKDKESRNTLREFLESRFEFKAHDTNYFLPYGHRKDNYETYVASDVYTNIEAEFQFSIKFDLASNLLGLQEVYSGAYTQKSFWQIYAESSPFRENNYNPEAFVHFPALLHENFEYFKGLTLGIAHQSNGQGSTASKTSEILANRSRSWNYAYAAFHFKISDLIFTAKVWKRYEESAVDDDNPDLLNYLGYGKLSFVFPYKKALFRGFIRHNPGTNKGALEVSVSVPVPKKNNVFFYSKIFSGYGESLIDYNRNIVKTSFGLSFSR